MSRAEGQDDAFLKEGYLGVCKNLLYRTIFTVCVGVNSQQSGGTICSSAFQECSKSQSRSVFTFWALTLF